MGSDNGRDDEKPVHKVWTDAFELGTFQITNREYQGFLEAAPYSNPSYLGDRRFNHPNQPIIAVSWYDALAYCKWLSQITGKRYRLPTEAEWEKAARGGLEGACYSWGDEPFQLQPDYAMRWRDGRPEPVGTYRPNRYGLYNIGDNVHEWCLDWYDAAYYRRSPEANPQGPESGTRRASRGGSWRHQIKISRCAARSSLAPSYRYTDYGFRVARSIG